MNPSPTAPAGVLHGLGELVAYVPYLLGFHPSASIVIVAHRAGSTGPVARFDVRADPAEQRQLVQQVLDQLRRADPEHYNLVLFGDDPTGRDQVRAVAVALAGQSAPVHHVVVVRPATSDGPARWRTVSCRCGGRCPRPWADVPTPDRVPVVADRVLEEIVPARDRGELVSSLRPRPLVSRAVWALRDGDDPTPAAYGAAVLAVLNTSDDAVPVERLPPHVLADVLFSWVDRSVRDHLMGWLIPDALGDLGLHPHLTAALQAAGGAPGTRSSRTDPTQVNRMQERLRALVSCAPEPLVPAPATMLGYWCWLHGGGALASVALDRALDADPTYRMAQLLDQVVRAGVRPDQLGPTRREEAG